jgi:hypothetical protein
MFSAAILFSAVLGWKQQSHWDEYLQHRYPVETGSLPRRGPLRRITLVTRLDLSRSLLHIPRSVLFLMAWPFASKRVWEVLAARANLRQGMRGAMLPG